MYRELHLLQQRQIINPIMNIGNVILGEISLICLFIRLPVPNFIIFKIIKHVFYLLKVI